MPLVFGYGRMLKKDIVYTAITRAAQTLLICGEQGSFSAECFGKHNGEADLAG
ncbi:MAG: hypothetical protein U5K84_01225 [Alkalibacterium sp.]|nr:hypothetical protein [Alkalibacterium sp.]